VFFQISTVEDSFGAVIGQPLHLSVHPHQWWLNLFLSMGFDVLADREGDVASIFVAKRKPSAMAA
jgi:hypothetical protein